MNTQAQVHHLQSGQALPLPRRLAAPAVLAEGELLLQAPARWLGGTVVLPPPVRLVAPAVLPAEASGSVVAVRAAKVVVQEAEPALAAWMRRLGLKGGLKPAALAP